MINQYLKDLYYLGFAKISFFSLYWNRLQWRSKKFYGAFVNICSGDKYVKGMINVDGNIFRKKDIWLDITLGLPFADNSIQGIYIYGALEHFNSTNVKKMFSEFYRVLKKGGGLRIVVPSLEYCIKAYNDNDILKLSNWPEQFNSIGGRFNNYLLCSNQHFLMFDFSFLNELLTEAGFRMIVRKKANDSAFLKEEQMELSEPKEEDPLDPSLYVEAFK